MAEKKRLRICFLGQKRIPSRIGGVEIVVEELAVRMAALGHSVTCYNRSESRRSEKNDIEKLKKSDIGEFHKKNRYVIYKGVRLKRVPTIDKKGLAAVSASFFATVAAAFGKYDVVHIHAEGPAFMCFLPKLFGKRVVVTVHGLDHQRAKWGRLASAFIMMGEKNAVRHADEIIVLSRNVQQYFKDTYGRDTVYIPNGVNRPEIVSAKLINEKFGLEKDSYILYLGRLVPEKGVQYLIDAYNKAAMSGKKLVIAGGSGDTDEFVEALKEKACGNEQIIFTGFVQGRTLEELYSNAYCYVLPSDLEGMPLSLLEAMSYGNCCLTSDISECAEVLEDKGVTFKKGNVNDLRDKLEELCRNEAEVRQYKAAASEFICGKYNWDNVVQQTLVTYRE